MNDTGTRTLRGLGQDGETEPPEDRTRTLRGLGIKPDTLRGLGEPAPSKASTCPCCRVKADEVSADLAACFGIALVLVKGAEPSKGELCVMHARLFRLIVDEMNGRPGQKRRDCGSWDD